GTGNPPQDVDNIVDALIATGAGLSVLNAAYSGGADPSGTADSTAALNAALSAASPGQVVTGPAGVYKTTAPLVVPNGVGLQFAATRAMGIPIGNYGLGGMALAGAVIRPSPAFSGAAVISLLGSASQGGGQNLRNITIDGTTLPAGAV